MTHHELCCLVAKKFFKRHFNVFGMRNTQYVAIELNTICREIPDVFGFGGNYTQLFEVKMTHADFLNDKKKKWKNFSDGVGEYRTYVCPEGVIDESELPEKYGLLHYDEVNEWFWCKRKPEKQSDVDKQSEIQLILSIMRRENIKPQIFDYRYTNKTIKNKYILKK